MVIYNEGNLSCNHIVLCFSLQTPLEHGSNIPGINSSPTKRNLLLEPCQCTCMEYYSQLLNALPNEHSYPQFHKIQSWTNFCFVGLIVHTDRANLCFRELWFDLTVCPYTQLHVHSSLMVFISSFECQQLLTLLQYDRSTMWSSVTVQRWHAAIVSHVLLCDLMTRKHSS